MTENTIPIRKCSSQTWTAFLIFNGLCVVKFCTLNAEKMHFLYEFR